MTYKHIDFEVPGFGELGGPPAVLPGYRDALLGRSPSALWPLDEDQGTTLADLAGSQPLTLTGGFSLGVPAAHAASPGGAVQFSGGLGSASSAVLPTTPGAAWSLAFWVRRAGTAKVGAILGQYAPAAAGRLIVEAANKARLKVTIDAGPSVLSVFKITTAWAHVVLTRSSGGTASWYINGELDASGVLGADAIADVPFALGNVAVLGLPVELDQVAAFPAELDAATVRWLFRLATGLPTSSTAS